MRLVDEQQVVAGEVVHQRERRRARRASFEDPRVVLDTVAVAEFAQHFDVVLRALADAMRLEDLAVRLKCANTLLHLAIDLLRCAFDRQGICDVVRRGIDHELLKSSQDLAREWVVVRDRLDLVAEQRDPIRRLHVRGLQLDDIATRTKLAAPECCVVAPILDIDKASEQLVAPLRVLALLEDHEPLFVLVGRAKAVDARDRGHDDHVLARQQRGGGSVAQAVDVVVDHRVLLDIGIRRGDVRLGLVVVVVRHEVLDRVVRKELAKLVAELRRERLVVGDHKRGSLQLLNDKRHRGRLTCPRSAEQGDEALAGLHALTDARDRTRLIAFRLKRSGKAKRRHLGRVPHDPSAGVRGVLSGRT